MIYGIVVDQARAAGARVLTTALGRLSGNYVIGASSEAIADPGKRQAIANYLQRYKQTLAWVNADPDRWAAARAATTGVPSIYYRQELREQSTTPALLPVTDDAIRSQQAVADAFAEAKVIPARVDVKPLWDRSFSDVPKA